MSFTREIYHAAIEVQSKIKTADRMVMTKL